MASPHVTRYVRESDEISGIPTAIYWTTKQVADWICEIGYPEYRDCMEKNMISGRHLICLDASRLPDTGITDFEHIKDIAAKVRGLLGLEHIIKDLNVAMADPVIAYMHTKRRTGRITANTPFVGFMMKYRQWYQ